MVIRRSGTKSIGVVSVVVAGVEAPPPLAVAVLTTVAVVADTLTVMTTAVLFEGSSRAEYVQETVCPRI